MTQPSESDSPDAAESAANLRRELEQTIRELEDSNARLRDSEGRARALIEASSQMVWTTDQHGEVVEDSPSWRRFTGQTFDEWKGSGWLEVVHPDDRAATIAAWTKAVANIRPYEVEYRLLRADGEYRWTVARGVPQLNDDGEIIRWVGMNTDITDRKRNEAKILENQAKLVSTAAKLRVLFDQSFFFAGILDLSGVVIDVNDKALFESGYTREEIKGRKLWKTRWWEPAPEIQEVLKIAVARAAEGKSFQRELPYWTADGRQRIVDVVLMPARNDLGEVMYILPTAVDVTERKEAEARENQLQQELKSKERRLSMALKSAGLAAWEWSAENSVWDDRLYEMLGISPDIPASTPLFYKSVHPDDLAGLKQAWELATHGQGSYDHEFRIVRPDGEIRWLAGSGEFIVDDLGQVTRVYGVNWDITERKRAEENERRQKEIEDFLSDAVAALASSIDYEMTVDKVPQLCVPFLADWAFVDLIDPDGTPRRVSVACNDSADVAVASNYARKNTDDVPEHDGIITPISPTTISGHKIPAPALIELPLKARESTFGVLSLVSAHPFTSEDFRAAKELAERAATAIDNARLYQAAQMANAAKSEFLANMSHEIRTPMTAILGYTDLLIGKQNAPEELEFLQTIKRNGQHLLEIINDILDLSKIEAGKLKIAFEKFDPRSVIEDVTFMMKDRAREKDLTLDVTFRESLPAEVETDCVRFRQVLVNLVGNAVKFTDHGGINVTADYDEQADPPLLRVQVTDSGVGISPEQRKELFAPFSQGDAVVTKRFGGTGLGLAISQRLAGMLGGQITVESEPNVGSTFTCTIAAPRVEATRTPLVGGATEAAPPDSQSTNLACNLLVVDDRRDVHLLTKHILTDAGAAVEIAEDGLQALEQVSRSIQSGRPFDLILLDMQMPRMDGYTTATKLRELGYENPIIALTADAMEGNDIRCLEAGCNAYLSKPIDANVLLELVAEHSTESASKR